jgi:hypothetical protein
MTPRRDDDGDGAEQVGEYFQVGTPDIHGFTLSPVQQSHRSAVCDQAHNGDSEHRKRLDLGAVTKPAHAFQQHETRHPEQQNGIEGSSQDLQPLPPEGSAGTEGALGKCCRDQRQGDTAGVGQHMACVGEQRQRSGYPCPDELCDQHAEGDDQGEQQPLAVSSTDRRVGMIHEFIVPMPVGAQPR